MSAIKAWLENLSCAIGGDGEINDELMELGHHLISENGETRRPEAEDIQPVCRLVELMSPGFKHDYTDATRKYIEEIEPKKDYFLWVATTAGAKYGPIIGTAMVHLQHKLSYHCGTAAHLEDVVIDEEVRGLGIGECLVKTAIACARLHDCYKIMLTCRDKTIPYYERFHFERHDVGMRLALKEQSNL